MMPDTILCVGYARLPEGTTFEVLFKIFGVGLEIDPRSGIIVNAQTTCATTLGNEFLTGMFVNRNIETDIQDILMEIAKRYRAHGGKAILAATKKAYAEYVSYKEEENQKSEANHKPEVNHKPEANHKPEVNCILAPRGTKSLTVCR